MSTAVPRARAFEPKAIPFLLMHLAPLALVWTGWSWYGLAVAVASYYVRMFGITAGYHRYFSHRSFTTGRVFQFVLAFLAQASMQKGVIWWAANHRHHHWYSDKENDVHSPVRHGFWWSHVGWVVSKEWDSTDPRTVRDLTRYPEIVWLNHWHWVPGVAWAVLMTALFGWEIGLLWGFFISSILTWHGTFTINSLCHVIGKRVYATTDTSKNSAILAAITLGEGWHNNHHFYQRSAAQGWRWYEFDVTYMVLQLLQLVRVVSNVSKPPRHVIEKTIDRAILNDDGLLNTAMAARTAEKFHEQVEALSHAAESLLARAEQVRTEFRELTDWTRESMNARMDSLHESAAILRGRAEQLCREIRESKDRTLEALSEKVEAIQGTAQAVLESASHSPSNA